MIWNVRTRVLLKRINDAIARVEMTNRKKKGLQEKADVILSRLDEMEKEFQILKK